MQHDVAGLIDLMGGKESFAMKLDSLFMLDTIAENTGFVSDVSGFIGQYAHGNEPSHHVVYLYNYVDQPWKTQELIPEIFERFYKSKTRWFVWKRRLWTDVCMVYFFFDGILSGRSD